MLFFAADLTPRLQYIVRFVLRDLCGITFRFTSDPEAVKSFVGKKICYADQRLTEDAFQIKPIGLLSEERIRPQSLAIAKWEGLPVFFISGGDIPFDLFSAAFYLVSRYEEYLPQHATDLHGRYAHEQSLAYTHNFLHLPLVELWAMEFRKKLQVVPAEASAFRFIPTYDIDQAWCWRHKGLRRNAGGFCRDLINGQFALAKKRIDVLRGKSQDPFDVYEWMDALHLRYRLQPYYFFPVGRKNGLYDKHILPAAEPLRKLIQYHAAGYRTGLHPSWASRSEPELLSDEVKTLTAITGNPVEYSRYHYLAFSLPDGYRKLLDLGIRHDYSMGYGTINGFRASVSIPFLWFDLLTNEETDLMVYPFCWMDANSFYEQNYTPGQAYEELKAYRDVLKKVSGQMLLIWHNNFFGTDPQFSGWKEVYEVFLNDELYWEI